VVEPLPKPKWTVSENWGFDNKKKLIDEFVSLMIEKLKQQALEKSSSSKDPDGYWDRKLIKILDNV
jgi:hypothetical protein